MVVHLYCLLVLPLVQLIYDFKLFLFLTVSIIVLMNCGPFVAIFAVQHMCTVRIACARKRSC